MKTPDGKTLKPEKDQLGILVYEFNDAVLIEFSQQVRWVRMKPSDAFKLAERIIEVVNSIGDRSMFEREQHTHDSSVGTIGPTVYYVDAQKLYHYHTSPTGMTSKEIDTPHHRHIIPGGKGQTGLKQIKKE